MHFNKLAIIAAFFAGAIAAPVATSDEAPQLETRATEGVHLVNCNGVYSAVMYCSDDSNCNYNPTNGNECSEAGIDHWEGSYQSCAFPGGVTFSWDIESKAQSQGNYAFVGIGANEYHNYNIYKDDQHVMYYDGNGYACKSIYYALDV